MSEPLARHAHYPRGGSCEATFVGGPIEGRVQAFPGDAPPERMVIQMPVSSSEFTAFTYLRQPSEAEDGPAWTYVPEED